MKRLEWNDKCLWVEAGVPHAKVEVSFVVYSERLRDNS